MRHDDPGRGRELIPELVYMFMDTKGFGRPSRRDETQQAAESHETSGVLPKAITRKGRIGG